MKYILALERCRWKRVQKITCYLTKADQGPVSFFLFFLLKEEKKLLKEEKKEKEE